MSNLMLGLICGLVFGTVDVLLMIPMQGFADKKAAMTGAFISRFAIGFVIGITTLPVPPWLRGLIIGLLLSLPDAIITKAYAPIIGGGAVGGVIIGLVIGAWGK
jgi:hypothetical protein